jgi:serine/threonine protein kinase
VRLDKAPAALTIPDAAFPAIRRAIAEHTRFCLEEPIGAGGTGVVYIATHEELSLRRAIKVMYYADRADRDQFLDALKDSLVAAAQIRHPGFIGIHDFVAADDYAFVVMDLHNPDRNFGSFAAAGGLRAQSSTIIGALERIIDVLAHCHATPVRTRIRGSRGVFVHGDLKAANVLVDYRCHPIVTDWLIPNLGRDRRWEPAFPWFDTRMFGTPMYMPPEQAERGTVTPASDVWNFGVLAFVALTGCYPFEDERAFDEGTPRSLRTLAPLAPGWIEDVIRACLRADFRERPAHGSALLELWRQRSLRPPPSSRADSAGRTSLRRVFLSSTFRDLIAERSAVAKALARLGTVECITMENVGAHPVPPRDACLAAVEQSDLLVLLVGASNGSTDVIADMSFTRLEYEHARACGIPVLAYVRQSASADAPSARTADGQAERLPAFVAALDAVTFSRFSEPDELAIQVVCDVARLLQTS